MEHSSESASFPTLFEDDGAFGTPVGSRLTLFESDGKRAVYLGHVPIYVYEIGDQAAESACIAMLSHADLASDVAIGEAFGCHRNTVGRLARRLAIEGMAAVVPAKRGPKAPHKVTAEVLEVIEAESPRLSVAALAREIAERTGVRLSVSHVRRLVDSRRPVQPELPASDEAAGDVTAPADEQPDAGEIDDEPDARPEDGLAAASGSVDASGADDDSCAAVVGFDPPAIPPRRARGRYMGLSLYYPAIAALG